MEEIMELMSFDSIGCHVDMETGNTYPTNIDGTPDLGENVECNLLDIENDEWFENLSPEDTKQLILGLMMFYRGENHGK